jgi:Leucine-rich repeat (LRR) protein
LLIFFTSFSLHLLSLGGNKLRSIPESIGLLSQLQLLNLCDNFLEAIPSSVARLHNLKTLSLHKNSIRTLPRDLISLENLTEVSDKNFLDEFCLLIEMLKLSLRDNPLVVRFVQGKSAS